MHIVDVSKCSYTTETEDLRPAGGVATLLYNYRPEALAAFLNPAIEIFHISTLVRRWLWVVMAS